MKAINYSTECWYVESFNEIIFQKCLANEEDIDLLKDIFRYDTNYFKTSDIVSLAHLMSLETDLSNWQYKYQNVIPCQTIMEYDKSKDKIIYTERRNADWFDGYSQIHYALNLPYDWQIFGNEYFLNIFVCTIEGGIACRINKTNNKIILYHIVEDDGSWYISSNYISKDFGYLYGRLMSIINEIHDDNLNHQAIIEQLWKEIVNVKLKNY